MPRFAVVTIAALVMPVTAALAVAAAQEGLVLEPERLVEFETDRVTWLSLDVSPDGGTLVLEVLGDLYLLPAAGGEARPLTRGMAFDSQPAFSPDGQRIAFVSDRDGAENVWVMRSDGSEPVRLSDNREMAEFASPSWAPDGSHVVASRTTWGLRTFEAWAYHLQGGKGVRLTRAKPRGDTPVGQRGNSLGAVYGPDGRYLYYAHKLGGFGYNLTFPQWQIVRHDLRTGAQDRLTDAVGSAFRPLLSPDGSHLVYGTRHRQRTGLRIRHLSTGEDRWLIHPVERDDQESRFTRDLLPGYAFTPDGKALLVARGGGIHRVAVDSGAVTEVPFRVQVRQPLGPALRFPQRLGVGPVKARLIRDPALSPQGRRVAFSAFTRVHVHDLVGGATAAITPEDVTAFHPAWSPDGRWLVYVSWDPRGGHIWRIRADGRGQPVRLTAVPGFYTDPVVSPDGERIVALRASSHARLYREHDVGAPAGSDVVWLPAGGGRVELVVPSRGYGRPHFGPEADRILLYQTEDNGTGLISVRFDGTDRRNLITVRGPGIYLDEEDVPADDVRLSPDGRHALVLHANQLYLASLVNPQMQNVTIDLDESPVPLARLTDVGADFFGWGPEGEIFWSAGSSLHRRPVSAVAFEARPGGPGGTDDSEADGAGEDTATEAAPLREVHASVRRHDIALYAARHVPRGRLALTGATVLPMTGSRSVIENAVVLVEGDRITAVGGADEVMVPDGVERLDLAGRFVLPGYVDTHAHFRLLRRALDTSNWAFLANLAYGVTTALDVQPGTIDVLSYQDLIDAGMMMGPRALSTGPGIFSNNEFRSARHTLAVLRRYRDSYRVHNLKAYLAGNRQQRQWIVQAARQLGLMPTTEGALDMKLDLTHVIDGFSGNEHNFPPLTLHRDVVELVARAGIAYTPALLVSYGGPFAESWFYTRESPHRDPKLARFTPYHVLAPRTLRGPWAADEEHVFPALAAQAAKIVRAGGRVGVGSHGQLQGLGWHWELWALGRGLDSWAALTAATRHGAEIIGVDADLGTVAPGKLADLVVLEANPLQDLRHSAALEYVMKNGELYDAETLDRVYPVATPLPRPWWWNDGPR